MEWRQNGRQLKTASANGKNLSYAYNDQGIRTQKTVDGVTTEYYLNGSAIYTQVTGSTRLDFLYDDAGDLLGFLYNGRGYYYVRNGQNDITGILNSDGTQVVAYTYDAWGTPTSTTGTEADTIGSLNPFRYRGYYYDAESSLYYLNSRYYDPQVGRFLNADALLGANKDLISYNVFAYCSNNPVNCYDESGCGKIWNSIKNAVTKVKNWITGTSAPPVVYSPSGQKIGGGNYISGNASSYIYTSKKQSQKLPTHGKPNSTAKTPDGKTEREYGPDGRAKKDTHYGHPEHHPELESPHYHDWDWIGNIGKPGAAYNFNNALLIGVGLVVGASVALIWIVGNDITGVGITDDAAILPLLGMFGQGAKMLAGG